MSRQFRERLGFATAAMLYEPGNQLEDDLGFFADDGRRPAEVINTLYGLVQTLQARATGYRLVAPPVDGDLMLGTALK